MKNAAIRAQNICVKLPSSDNWIIPPITPDPEHPGHYQNFLQITKAHQFSAPDEHVSCTTHEKWDK